jgi:hypothetical protein
MTGPQPTASAEVEAALVEIVNDATVTHPMWIGDDGQPLDYLPEREAQISDFVRGLAADLAAYVQAALDEERERVLGEVDTRITEAVTDERPHLHRLRQVARQQVREPLCIVPQVRDTGSEGRGRTCTSGCTSTCG